MKKNNNKRHHAYLVEDEDEEEEERPRRKQAKEEDVEEYVLFSALSRFVIPREYTWLIDSASSNHMTGKKQTPSILEETLEEISTQNAPPKKN